MRQRVAVVLLAISSLASAQMENGSRPRDTSVREAIRKLDDERVQAQIHADAVALDRLYADDFIGVAAGWQGFALVDGRCSGRGCCGINIVLFCFSSYLG